MPSSLPATVNSFFLFLCRDFSFLSLLCGFFPSFQFVFPRFSPPTQTVSQLVIITVFFCFSFPFFCRRFFSLQNLIYTIMLLTYFELVLFFFCYKGIRRQGRGKRSPLCNLPVEPFFFGTNTEKKKENGKYSRSTCCTRRN